MRIRITTNAAQLERELTQFAQKELPKAMARTLTALAKEAQKKVREELPSRFRIRNDYVSRGIETVPAEKSDGLHSMKAVIGSRNSFMRLQEEGGDKPRLKGLGLLAAPLRSRVRPVESEVIRPGLRPMKLLQLVQDKKNYRLETLKSNSQKAIVFRPQSKSYLTRAKRNSALALRRRQARLALSQRVRVLWVLPEQVTLKPRWQFFETVQKAVAGQYEKVFGKYFAEAIAKRPSK
jgi:hypothetical protein